MVPQSEDWLSRSETLAERLERGPLPLSLALHYAYDIARALRELHQAGQAHGSVSGRAIELRPSGAVLGIPAAGFQPESAWRSDLRGFGWVLRSMFPDEQPPEPPGSSPPSTCAAGSTTSATGVWEAARRLTARCLADPPQSDLTMRKLVSELRLLDIVARQWAKRAESETAGWSKGPRIWRETGWELEREPLTLPLPSPEPPPPASSAAPPSALEISEPIKEPRISPVRCPRCYAHDVRPSEPRTSFEDTLDRFHLPVLRCHRCSFRFFRFLFLTIRKKG